MQQVMEGVGTEFHQDNEELFHYQERLCVPTNDELLNKILKEPHQSAYSIHFTEYKDVSRLEIALLVAMYES